MRNNRGFTLIELLVVLVILGAVLALSRFGWGAVEARQYESNITDLVIELNRIRQHARESGVAYRLEIGADAVHVEALETNAETVGATLLASNLIIAPASDIASGAPVALDSAFYFLPAGNYDPFRWDVSRDGMPHRVIEGNGFASIRLLPVVRE